MTDIPVSETFVLKSIIPAANVRAVMVDKSGERYIAPVVCWGLYEVYLGEKLLLYNVVKGLILGSRETLIELQNNEAFRGYLYGDEDSSSLPDDRS